MRISVTQLSDLLKKGDVYLRNQEGDVYLRLTYIGKFKTKAYGKLKDKPEYEFGADSELATEIMLWRDTITKDEYYSGKHQGYAPRIQH